MLPNYDAKAIAEVMGLGFLRGSTNELSSDVNKARMKTGPDRDFVIEVDNKAMLLVEISTKNGWLPFEAAKNVRKRFSEFESDRVPSPSPILIERAVESGLPRKTLRHVAEAIVGSDSLKVSNLEWDVVPKTTLDRRGTKLSPKESERTERAARLFVQARRALGTAVEARDFMTTPHPELDGRSPIDASKTDLGTRRTEQILSALEYGLAL